MKGNKMSVKLKHNTGYQAYVAGDGNYGVDSVITFDYDDFADFYPNVFDLLDNFSDSCRWEFIQAIFDEDEEALVQLCEEHDVDPYPIISKW
jgi:hypothetical protein